MRPGAKSKSKYIDENDKYVISDEKLPEHDQVDMVPGEKREDGEGQAEGVTEDSPPPVPEGPPPTESEEEREHTVRKVGKEEEQSRGNESEATQLSSVQAAMSDGGDAPAGKEPGKKYRSPRGKRTGAAKQLNKVTEAAAAGLKAAEEAGVVKEAISAATTTATAPITPPKTPEEKVLGEFFKAVETPGQKSKEDSVKPEARTPEDPLTYSPVGSSSQVSTPGTEEPSLRVEEDVSTESEQLLTPELPPEIIMSGEQSERREHLYKILVIGELGTGKTSIIKRYVHQFFSQHYRATIGVDFALKVLNWDANTIIRLQLWDIAGQERFGNMTRVYYKEAVGAFIVFDVTRTATFEAVVKWKQDLDLKVQLPDGSPIPCVLLANKCDQPKEGIVNNAARMEEYCKERGFCGWFETSAKENINIDEAARFLVSKILQSDKWSHSESVKDGDKIALESRGGSTEGRKEKTCSC